MRSLIPYFQDNAVTLYVGHALDVLRALPAESVQMCVTSPPYWGLRDYGLEPIVWGDAWRGSLGLEPTPDCGRPFMELRPDLTDAQRVFVHQRLEDAGLLDAAPCGTTGTGSTHSRRHSAVPDTGPTDEGGVPQDARATCSPDNASHRGRRLPSETSGTSVGDNPSPAQESGLPSNSDGQNLRDASSSEGDSPQRAHQLQSPDDAQARAGAPSRREQSAASSRVNKAHRDLSASLDEQQQSLRGPQATSPGWCAGSATSSGKTESRTDDPARRTAHDTDCICGSTAWAYYILPQDIQPFFRYRLCAGCYVCHLVDVFREVWRVLRNDGTLWLNLGDSYISAPHGTGATHDPKWPGGRDRAVDRENRGAGQRVGHRSSFRRDRREREDEPHRPAPGLKPKDMVGIPWRAAFALQDDGWYLRMDVDDALRHRRAAGKPVSGWAVGDGDHSVLGHTGPGGLYRSGNKERKLVVPTRPNDHRGSSIPWEDTGAGRNKRSVWTIATAPFPEAHFATFPPALVKPCVLAGTSARGACATCETPWERVSQRRLVPTAKAAKTGIVDARDVSADRNDQGSNRQKDGHVPGWRRADLTTGWRPACRCYDQRYDVEFPRSRSPRQAAQRDLSGDWRLRVRRRPGRSEWPTVPCVALDPFAGAGTVLMVAKELGRHAVGIELKQDYADLAVRRIPREVQLTLEGAH